MVECWLLTWTMVKLAYKQDGSLLFDRTAANLKGQGVSERHGLVLALLELGRSTFRPN
jgi:hypothetical protein